MVARLKTLIRHDFVSSSLIVLVGANIVNVLNYLFTVIMGRLLAPTQYGEVATLIALSLIISVPSNTVITVTSKYISGLSAKHEMRTIDVFASAATRFVFLIGVAMYVVFLVASPLIASFLKIPILPVIIFGLCFPITLLSAVMTGALQALQRFVPYSLITIIAAGLKFVLGIIFVLVGFKTAGVMGAIVLGFLASYIYAYFYFERFIKAKEAAEQTTSTPTYTFSHRSLSPYVMIVFLSTLLISIFSNTDVTLAKHYLQPTIAGQYAALSVTGNIIFYSANALVGVMFPLVAKAYVESQRQAVKWFSLSLLTAIAITLPLVLLFMFFPALVLRIIYGSKYLIDAPVLGIYGLAEMFMTIAVLFINYFMAIKEQRYIYPLVFFIMVEIGLIATHHTSVQSIAYSVLAASIGMLTSMITVFLLPRRVMIVSD